MARNHDNGFKDRWLSSNFLGAALSHPFTTAATRPTCPEVVQTVSDTIQERFGDREIRIAELGVGPDEPIMNGLLTSGLNIGHYTANDLLPEVIKKLQRIKQERYQKILEVLEG